MESFITSCFDDFIWYIIFIYIYIIYIFSLALYFTKVLYPTLGKKELGVDQLPAWNQDLNSLPGSGNSQLVRFPLCTLYHSLSTFSFHLGISSLSWIWFGVCTWLGLGKEKDTKYHRLAARRAKTRQFGVAEMWDERCQHGTSRGRIRCCAKGLCLFGLGKWMASANWIRRFCWVRGCTSGKQICRCSVELLCRI